VARRTPPELAEYVMKADGGCVAPKVDPSQIGKCWGRLSIEHVKDQLRMSKRAEDDRFHLVTLCLGHTEPGMKAGYQWNTNAANRAKIREWIAKRES
jgi:hypothetical protein